MQEEKNISVIILAAGFSSRMKFPKPFLIWEKNITFLEKIVNEYKTFGCNRIIVVLNKSNMEYYNTKGCYFLNDIQITINEFPEYERFYSIKLGLDSINKALYCFIQNVDSPFIDFGILSKLYKNRQENVYLVPAYKNKKGHPILLSRSIIESIKNETDYTLNFKDVISGFDKKVVEMESGRFLFDINTRGDYQKLND